MEHIKALWNNFYNSTLANIDFRLKGIIGFTFIMISLISFIFCTRGKSKGNIVNNWPLFWISMITLIIGAIYLSK